MEVTKNITPLVLNAVLTSDKWTIINTIVQIFVFTVLAVTAGLFYKSNQLIKRQVEVADKAIELEKKKWEIGYRPHFDLKLAKKIDDNKFAIIITKTGARLNKKMLLVWIADNDNEQAQGLEAYAKEGTDVSKEQETDVKIIIEDNRPNHREFKDNLFYRLELGYTNLMSKKESQQFHLKISKNYSEAVLDPHLPAFQ